MRMHGKWLATTAILTVGFAFAPPPGLHAQTSVALTGRSPRRRKAPWKACW